MNFYLYAGLNFSIFLAGVIGIFRFNKINKIYYPFVILIWIGCINETLSFFLALNRFNTYINGNLYVLTESLLLALFFFYIGFFKNKKSFVILVCFLFACWLTENFIVKGINESSTYFRIVYSFLLVFMSINIINQMIFTYRKNLLKNPIFLLCISFIVYFTSKALTEAFAIYGFSKLNDFLMYLQITMVYINFGVNIIYAIAILWMKEKLKYLQPSSLH